MKVKKLETKKPNDFLYMGIKEDDSTLIYLHRVSVEGKAQWYESKGLFTKNTALKYFYAGKYKVVFAQGITKSNEKNWC